MLETYAKRIVQEDQGGRKSQKFCIRINKDRQAPIFRCSFQPQPSSLIRQKTPRARESVLETVLKGGVFFPGVDMFFNSGPNHLGYWSLLDTRDRFQSFRLFGGETYGHCLHGFHKPRMHQTIGLVKYRDDVVS
jgi:hypothetical protein